MEHISHTRIHTERGQRNLRQVKANRDQHDLPGLTPTQRRLLKKVRTRKRRQLHGDELPSL